MTNSEIQKSRYLRRIELGAWATTFLVGMPLILCFTFSGMYIEGAKAHSDRVFSNWNLNEPLVPYDEHVKRRENQTAEKEQIEINQIEVSRLEYTLEYGSIVGILLGLLVCIAISVLVSSIFQGLHPVYDP